MKLNKILIIMIPICAGILINGCKKDSNSENAITNSDSPYELEIGQFPKPDLALDNPLTKEGVKLGRMLFYEKKMSKNNAMACASCHMQEFAFSDTSKLSLGVAGMPGKRHAMAVFNTAWHSNEFFWDGRSHLLRDQSLKPIQDELEMEETLDNVVNKLQGITIYQEQFKKAFGTSQITPFLMSKAMEQFMNSIVSVDSKYDQFLGGKATLSTEEERGRFLFFTEYNPAFPDASGADCQHCHGGANFENDKYMNNGLDNNGNITDKGRENVTQNPADIGKFKVTSLRNVELTHPYMHDGRFKTLEEVIEHYNLVKSSTTLDGSFLQQLPNGGLKLTTMDKKALVAFLKTLTDYKLITNPAYSSPF